MRLRDRVAIVTGGGAGIGRATSLALAREGAIVAVGDVRSETALATAATIAEAGGRAMGASLDVASPASVEAFVADVLRRYDRVDALVNNAGGVPQTPGERTIAASVVDCTESDWDATFARNAKGTFLMSRAVLPSMIRQRSGSIVNVGSTSALVGLQGFAAYSAAKGAVVALTRAMAADHGPDGIRVNCVCPGRTMTEKALRQLAATPDPEATRRTEEEQYPLLRLGEPADIANMITFLCCDESSWITGAIVPVDGGNTASRLVGTFGSAKG